MTLGYVMVSMIKVNSVSKWKAQNYFQNDDCEKLRKQFCFLNCILPDYVANKNFKEFGKNDHFENVRADILRRCQNSLRQIDDVFAGITIFFFFCCYYVVALDPIKILTH